MANDGRVSAYQEELYDLTLEELIEKTNKERIERENKFKFELEKKRERELAQFTLDLRLKNANITDKEVAERQEQFLNELKIKEGALKKELQEDQYKQELKDTIAHFKEKSKLAEKERKKEQKLLEQELEVVMLRSQVRADGEAKSPEEQKADRRAADLKENLAMLGDSFKDVGKGIRIT